MSCFKNTEFIRGIICGIIVVIIAIFINNMFVDRAFETLKINYLSSQATIVGKIFSYNPALATDIVSLLKQENSDYEKRGYEVLKNYGYDEKLNTEFIPPLDTTIKHIKLYNLVFDIILALIILFILALSLDSIYHKIRKLTENIKDDLDGKTTENQAKYLEGDYGKLVFALEDVQKRLNSNIDTLGKEKLFLINTLSDISHQLKTPLSALRMYNEILLNDKLSQEEKDLFLNNSKLQLNRMEWLIKSLLKLSKLDAGAICFNMKSQSLNKTLNESLDMLYTNINEKNISVHISDSQIELLHDREWLSEALINIIKNDIEHMCNGGQLTISFEDNSIFTKVIISDNGHGIEKQELPKIFNRFYKGIHNQNKESIGIGLSLSKAIIEANGGFIEVESTLGVGTKFILTFLKYLN